MGSKIFILPLLAIAILSLSACGHTFSGIGRDMQEWGKTMDDTF